MVDQSTGWGNLNYNQSGTWEDGSPKYSATQTYSPAGQKIFDNYANLSGQLGDIGNSLAGNVSSTMSQPFKLGNEATEGRLMELGRKRLDPMFAEREQSTESDLLNRGIRPGTPAYESIKRTESEGRNDAYNSLLLNGRAQASNELLTERNQPLQELMAMLGGSQVQQPNLTNTPNTNVAGVDYAGLEQNKFNQESGQYNAMMGGLMGLGGTALGAWGKTGFAMPSERELKTDIVPLGRDERGIMMYRFRYRAGGAPQLGYMVDEVEPIRPDAIVTIHGRKGVDIATLRAAA